MTLLALLMLRLRATKISNHPNGTNMKLEILNKRWKRAPEYHPNGILPKGHLPWWTALLPEEIDGILLLVDKFRALVGWLLHQDSVELKLQLEVKLQLQEDGLSQHQWEWWQKLQLLVRVDLGKHRVEPPPQDGIKNPELLPLLKVCKLQWMVTILWWHRPQGCLKCLDLTGRKIFMIETSLWPMKSLMHWSQHLDMR